MNSPKKKMKVGKHAGDLTGVPDRKSTNKVADARVAQAIAQSQNGFKGESLNDHGLPDGHVSRPIIQSPAPEGDGAKFRRHKELASYKEGAKSISTKPDYQAAAKSIRANDDLYSQYKEGVASGKAFSLTVDGKVMKYAATKAPPASGLPGGDIAAASTPTPAAPAPRKMAVGKVAHVRSDAASKINPAFLEGYEGEQNLGPVTASPTAPTPQPARKTPKKYSKASLRARMKGY